MSGPEVKLQKLFMSRFMGVVREGHPLSKGKDTANATSNMNTLVLHGGISQEDPLTKRRRS